MEIHIIGFIITVLLIPLIVYVWNSTMGRIRKMENRADKNEERINQCEVDMQETKTNYTQKFSDLKEQINEKFNHSYKVQTQIQVSIKGIETTLKMIAKDEK